MCQIWAIKFFTYCAWMEAAILNAEKALQTKHGVEVTRKIAKCIRRNEIHLQFLLATKIT